MVDDFFDWIRSGYCFCFGHDWVLIWVRRTRHAWFQQRDTRFGCRRCLKIVKRSRLWKV